jgi:hypothetical protein
MELSCCCSRLQVTYCCLQWLHRDDSCIQVLHTMGWRDPAMQLALAVALLSLAGWAAAHDLPVRFCAKDCSKR